MTIVREILEEEHPDGIQPRDLDPEPAPPPLIPLQLDRNLLEWHRVSVDCAELKIIKVIFDHCSSGDGSRQKGYANCLKHENYFRWRTCRDFRDRNHFAAHMYSWATTGEDKPNRDEHMDLAYEPPQEDVYRVLSSMTLTEF